MIEKKILTDDERRKMFGMNDKIASLFYASWSSEEDFKRAIKFVKEK